MNGDGAVRRAKKIAYLFGAGATHAELVEVVPDLIAEKDGLLIKDLSTRVIAKAGADDQYRKNLETVSSPKGSLNIELLISLIQNSKVEDWAKKAELLKSLVAKDIRTVLSEDRLRKFFLHRALIRMHNEERNGEEEVIGFLSLNYDSVLDDAYEMYHGSPDYCFVRSATSGNKIPLLKLHGSFGWHAVCIRGRRRTIEIIPVGLDKSYLHTPYTFIWNRALEVLTECDILRVVGCSLSQNDEHLIDLLFKAHLERQNEFGIEVIAATPVGVSIQRNYGFFPKIQTLTELEGYLVPDPEPVNPFKTWLKYKSRKLLGDRVDKLKYLKSVAS